MWSQDFQEKLHFSADDFFPEALETSSDHPRYWDYHHMIARELLPRSKWKIGSKLNLIMSEIGWEHAPWGMTFRKETIMVNLPRKSVSNDRISIFSNSKRKRSHPQLYLINFHCCRWWKLLESKPSNRATGLSPFRIWHFLRGWTCFSHCMADIRRSGSFPKFTSRFYLVSDGI